MALGLTRIGASVAEATSITIPGSFQNGDLIFIFAYNAASTTIPTTGAGFSLVGSGTSGSTNAATLGWKIAVGGDTSGTWTNASGIASVVYRNQATNKTPEYSGAGAGTKLTGSSATATFSQLVMKCPGTSWILAFIGTATTTTTLSTPPTGLTLAASDGTKTACNLAAYDTNGPSSNATGWPQTNLNIVTSSNYADYVVEIFPEMLGYMGNDYMAAKDNATGDTGILGFSERTR